MTEDAESRRKVVLYKPLVGMPTGFPAVLGPTTFMVAGF